MSVEWDRVVRAGAASRIARLREREPLWPNRLDRAARDVAVALAARGYLESRVTAAARRQPGGADAVFTVLAGPKARVGAARIEGAGGLEAVLRRYIRPAPGRVFLRDKARSAAEAMRRQLVRDGRWRAQVDLDESYDPARASPSSSGAIRSAHRREFEGALGRASAPPEGCSATAAQGGRGGGGRGPAEKEFHRQGHRDASVWREETRDYRSGRL